MGLHDTRGIARGTTSRAASHDALRASRSVAIASRIEDDGLDVSCGLVVVDAEEEADALTHDRCPGAAPRATGPCARGRAGVAPPASPSGGGPRCSPGPR